MKYILEYMEDVVEVATISLDLLLRILILITVPLWILPFMIRRFFTGKDYDEDDVYDWDEYTSATR